MQPENLARTPEQLLREGAAHIVVTASPGSGKSQSISESAYSKEMQAVICRVMDEIFAESGSNLHEWVGSIHQEKDFKHTHIAVINQSVDKN